MGSEPRGDDMRVRDAQRARPSRTWLLATIGAALASACASPEDVADPSLDDALRTLEARAEALETDVGEVDAFIAREMEPLVHVLTRMRNDRPHARRIALALVREGQQAGVDPRLLLAVMAIENPWLEPTAASFMGAVGLMQVMPFHAGAWGCDGADLTDPETNICHGARILAHALARANGDLDRALLRYNGCVRGTNTPDCHLYPSKVLGNPELVALDM